MNTTPATNDATRDTTGADLSRQGIALLVAARLLGVSLRTVQRRLDRGELGFLERDGKRFVLLESGATGHDKPRDNDATNDTTARQVASLSSERESELKEEIRFLRGLVEQRDRDAAELRAALREALKIAPRQLEAGESSASGNVATQNARIEQHGPQNGETGRNSPQPLNGARIASEREEAGIGEEMGADELRELCFRVARGP